MASPRNILRAKVSRNAARTSRRRVRRLAAKPLRQGRSERPAHPDLRAAAYRYSARYEFRGPLHAACCQTQERGRHDCESHGLTLTFNPPRLPLMTGETLAPLGPASIVTAALGWAQAARRTKRRRAAARVIPARPSSVRSARGPVPARFRRSLTGWRRSCPPPPP